MAQAQDRLQPSNITLTRLIALLTQLLQKRIQTLKTVDITYPEAIRLPAQYYVVRARQKTPTRGRKRKETISEK